MAEELRSESVSTGLFWKFGERFLSRIVAFAVSVVLARMVSPDEHGLITMVMIFITLADAFVVSGFATSLIQKKDADELDFSTIFYCSLAVSLLLYALLFFAAPAVASFYEEPLLVKVLRIFALRIPLSVYNSVQSAFVARHMIFKKNFTASLIGTVISGAAGIWMASLGFGVWALVGQYLTMTVISTLVLAFTLPWRPRRLFSWERAKSLMRYGWKVLAADLSGTFFDKLRSLIIGKVYTSADLAFFDKGQQLPSLVSDNISSAVMSVLFPAIANKADEKSEVKRMTRRAVGLMAYVIFPMMAGLAVVAKPLILTLYTEIWAESIPFVRILSLAAGLGLIGTTALQAIKAIGRSDVLLKLEFIKKPVYLLLLVFGVKKSVEACAVTVLVYTVYSTVINAGQMKKHIGYSFREQLSDLRYPVGLTLLMVIGAYLPGLAEMPDVLQLILQTLTGVIVYVGASKLLKCPMYTELLTELKNKLGK